MCQSKHICPPLSIVDNVNYSRPESWKNQFVLRHNYVELGLSVKQIADKFLSSKETIRKYLKLYEISLREKSQHHGNPAQVKFGQKLRKGEPSRSQARAASRYKYKANEGRGLESEGNCEVS